jgi:alpha-1,2-mannosyltransferase
LFVIYPHIAFAGAYSVYLLVDLCYNTLKLKPKYTQIMLLLVLGVVFSASLSRTVNLVTNYNGVFRVYTDLSQNADSYEKEFRTKCDQINVCVGREWYRFPNSYFLPNQRYNLTFFRQLENNSQLPQYFGSSTWEIRPNFNDKNADELSRYISIGDCHFLIDLDSNQKRELNYASEDWKLLSQFSFIDSSSSPTLTRVFYIPFYSAKKNTYNSYFLLLNKHK